MLVGALSQKVAASSLFAFSFSSFIFPSQHDFFSASVPLVMHVAFSELHCGFILAGALSQKVAASSLFAFSFSSFIFPSQHDFFSASVVLAMHVVFSELHC